MSVSVSTTAGTQVSVTIEGQTLLSFTTQESSVNVLNGGTTSISVTNQGPKGDTGATGATGATGPAGADGEGVIVGGSENQFLQKNSATDYDTKWSAYTLPAADGAEGTVLTTDGAGTVSFAFPQVIAENVKNVSGGPLYKGTPVHVTGSVGNLAEVIAADAATNYPAHFVLNEDLADEGEGLGIALGFINNVDVPDASIYSEGQTVYLGASGGWSTTKPTGTNAIQNLGIIIKVNTGGNKISGIVMGAGRSNDVPNIPEGQAWIGNASGVATPTTLADVATSGAYSDLSGTPTIPSGDLVDDTTPQLGGDLDVNGNKITSASNGDITIDPDGTGAIIMKSDDIQFDGGGTFGGKVKLYESDILGSNFIALSAPFNVTSDTTLYFPDGVGSSGQALTTDGSLGNLSWSDVIGPNSPTVNGVLSIEEGGADTGRIALYDIDGSNYILIKAADTIASNVTFVLPASDGSSGQVLKTDGSGNLSFVNQTTDTNTYLGSTNQTLSANRVVEMNGNTLDFQNGGTSEIKFFSAGTVQMNNRLTIDGDTANASIRMFDNGNSNAVTISTSGSMSGNVTVTLPTTNLTFPTSAGSSGQFMQTDGSGNLSFASQDPYLGPWVTSSGRFQFDIADANKSIACGSPYGPIGYYLWYQAMFDTVSSGTVDTTTQSLASVYQNYGGLRMPDTKKVSVDLMVRNANSTTYSKNMRLQVWSFSLNSSTSTTTMTLRADQTFTTPGNTYPANVSVTTTSAISADDYIMVFVAADNISLSGTGYIYSTMQLELTS